MNNIIMYIFSIILIIIGFIVFIQYNKSIIHKMVAIEIMVLGTTLIFIIYGYIFDDAIGSIYSLYIIAVISGESAIGLSFIIAYYNHYYV